MATIEESFIDIKKYLKKLAYTIQNNASLTLINVKIVDKSRVDDLLCCIDASFPEEYKEILKKRSSKKPTSYIYYRKLITLIKNKFILSSSSYSVRYKEALSIINQLVSAFKTDFERLKREQENMY